MSVKAAEDGRVVLHCFAGCPTESILDSLGLTFSDLFPDDNFRRNRKTPKPDLFHEKMILEIARSDRERGIPPKDLERIKLAIHRIKTVEGL